MKISTDNFLRPSSLALIAVLASATAWAIPDFGVLDKGYVVASPVTMLSALVIFNWYFLVWGALRLGEILGSHAYRMAPIKLRLGDFYGNHIYYAYTILAILGGASAYAKVVGEMSIQGAILYVSSGTANELKEALYDNYSPGLFSLRYLVVYSAAIALFRLFYLKKVDVLLFVNVLTLAFISLLSSRLMFVSSVLSALFLVALKRPIQVRAGRIFIFVVVAFSVLSVLNYSRNYNYYKGIGQGFFSAGVSSIVQYVGSPFQVVVGGANNIDKISQVEGETYRRYVDIHEALNTNSAFIALTERQGWLSWPYMIATLLSFGAIFAYCKRHADSSLILPCATILYASSEFWRVDVFEQGIFFVWLVLGLSMPFFLCGMRAAVSVVMNTFRRQEGGA
jgi:hypothetical protein